MLNIQETPANTTMSTFFRLAFRPFFLLAPLMALCGLLLWIAYYAGWFLTENYWAGQIGHSHEMLYGFAVAIVAGFLLTAARTWTGLETISGKPLMLLVIIWLAARILPWLDVPTLLVAITDLLFLPMVAVALAIPVIRVGQKRNFIFLPILVLLWLGNLMMHLQQLSLINSGGHAGLYLGVDLILLLIIIIGGRVIPMFTGNGIGETIKRSPQWDKLAIFVGILFVLVHQFSFQGYLLAVVCILAFIIHAIRAWRWYHKKIWSTPLVWILHVSYYWIIIGFLLMAAAAIGYGSLFLALHAFTVGGISAMILGMISRVSLGHTGRPLEPPKLVVVGFVLMPLASAVRIFIPFIDASLYSAAVVLSGVLWVTAMLLFVISYAGILMKPRVDGLPG